MYMVKYARQKGLIKPVHPQPQVPWGFWDDVANQRSFIDQLVKKLNLENEGLENLTLRALQKHGGGYLLKKYDYSISKLLATISPDYHQKCRQFVMNIVKDLRLSKVEDMLQVPLEYLQLLLKLLKNIH